MFDVLPLLTRSKPGAFWDKSSVRVVWSSVVMFVTSNF